MTRAPILFRKGLPVNKQLASSALAICLLLASPGVVLSAESEPAHSEMKVVQKNDHTEIDLTQQAEQLAPRDRISITLSVEARGNNARQIQIDINKRMAAAIEKSHAVPAVTVETGSYSVSRPYDSQAKDADRWRGTQDLVLVSDDFEAALNLAGDLQGDGLVMGDMHFFVAPETLKAAQDDLTAQALAAMKERAGHIADNLGLKIERYKSINVGNATEEAGNISLKAGKAVTAASAKAAPPAVAAGNALITLQVFTSVIMAP
jgi:predicted secreted protein